MNAVSGTRRVVKALLWVAFVLYVLAAWSLIIGKGWGGFGYLRDCYASFDKWKDSVLRSLNLTPFRFIFDMRGYTRADWCANVLGNIILFIPAGVLLPCLAGNVRFWGWRRYIAAMTLAIGCIELMQLLLMCGSCDIDDLILGLAGACLGFAFMRLPSMRRMLAGV